MRGVGAWVYKCLRGGNEGMRWKRSSENYGSREKKKIHVSDILSSERVPFAVFQDKHPSLRESPPPAWTWLEVGWPASSRSHVLGTEDTVETRSYLLVDHASKLLSVVCTGSLMPEDVRV